MSFNVHVHEGFGFVGHLQLVCKCIRRWYCNCLMCSSNTYDTPVKKITQPLNFVMKLQSFKLRFRNDSLQNHPTSQLWDETLTLDILNSEQFVSKSRNLSTLSWKFKVPNWDFGTIHCIITKPLNFVMKLQSLKLRFRNNLLLITQPLNLQFSVDQKIGMYPR